MPMKVLSEYFMDRSNAEVSMRDHVIHRLDDVMRARMHRWQHLGKLMEHPRSSSVGPRRTSSDHANKVRRSSAQDRMRPSQGDVIVWVARMVGEVGRNGLDKLTDHFTVQVDTVPIHLCARAPPVFDGDVVPKYHADVFRMSWTHCRCARSARRHGLYER